MIRITLLLLATSLTSLNTQAGLLLSLPSVSSQIEEVQEVQEVIIAKTDREIVENYFTDAPVMVKIARCESSFRHTGKTGEVLRGLSNDQDVGIMQINERFHLEKAQKMDINIYSIEGNLEFARYLYEKEGTNPWGSSKKCWSQTS